MGTHKVYLHSGRVIWPEHKPLDEVLELQATTPESVWLATYQGTPTAPGGAIFKRGWWQGKNRYDIADPRYVNACYARYISLDTGLKEDTELEEDHDYTAAIVGELWPDYRLALRYVTWDRLEFPDLPAEIEALATRYNMDEKLRVILIEDKQSGTSALQTLRKAAAEWVRPLLVPFMPTTDKITRAQQATVWCKNDCVLFPQLRPDLWWLADFEDQLFEFPKGAHDDMVDAFAQLILYLENVLEHGWRARTDGANQ